MVDRNLISSLPMLHIIKSSNVDFMKLGKPLALATTVFVVASLGFGISRGEKLFGVDFLGGDSTTYSFAQKLDEQQIRAALTTVGEKDAQIQYQKDVGAGTETLRLTTLQRLGGQGQSSDGTNFAVGAIQTARQPAGSARRSAKKFSRRPSSPRCCRCSGILVYVAFRYEFSFAVAAVAAVLHDVLFAIGAYCIANAVSGRQFNATVVAAILTIIGFSINDKIVIFDRIREQLKLGVRGSFKDIINLSLNQTLSRTIITSGTVFLATLLAVHLRRRRHQRLRVHVPRRHPRRHLLVHLHRERHRLVVAQRRTPEHRRVAGERANSSAAKV